MLAMAVDRLGPCACIRCSPTAGMAPIQRMSKLSAQRSLRITVSRSPGRGDESADPLGKPLAKSLFFQVVEA